MFLISTLELVFKFVVPKLYVFLFCNSHPLICLRSLLFAVLMFLLLSISNVVSFSSNRLLSCRFRGSTYQHFYLLQCVHFVSFPKINFLNENNKKNSNHARWSRYLVVGYGLLRYKTPVQNVDDKLCGPSGWGIMTMGLHSVPHKLTKRWQKRWY